MAEYTLNPSIIPEADDDFVDDAYSRAELERKERQELQAIASEHDTDAVNGKDTNEEIIEALTGEQRVE